MTRAACLDAAAAAYADAIRQLDQTTPIQTASEETAEGNAA